MKNLGISDLTGAYICIYMDLILKSGPLSRWAAVPASWDCIWDNNNTRSATIKLLGFMIVKFELRYCTGCLVVIIYYNSILTITSWTMTSHHD
jgi:hypothetical protein